MLSNDLPKFKPFLSNPLAENKDEMNTFKSGTNHKDDKFRGTKNVSLSVIALFRFNIVLDWVKGRKKKILEARLKITRPNGFGSMTTRKDNILP